VLYDGGLLESREVQREAKEAGFSVCEETLVPVGLVVQSERMGDWRRCVSSYL